MKMKKRLLSILLSLALVLGLMPGMSLTAEAEVITGQKDCSELNAGDVIKANATVTRNNGSFYVFINGRDITTGGANQTVTVEGQYQATGSYYGITSFTAYSDFIVSANEPPSGQSSYYWLRLTTHTHNFTYSASGATITATCGAAGCGLTSNPTLTIAAEGGTYDGTTAYSATVTNNIPAVTGDTVGDVAYYKVDMQGATTGGTAQTGAPTGAGYYYASVTLTSGSNTYTAVKAFTVAKADPTAPTDLTATYGQKLSDVALPTGWTWTDSTQSVGNVVSPAATFKANFAGNDNYNAASNEDVAVTVSKAANPATVTGTASVTKGGNTVDLANNVTKNGATGDVTYAIDGEANGCSLNGSVLTSGENIGTVTVNVTVATDENYNALVATPITVTISDKGTQTITASDVTATYGDTDKKVTATTNGNGSISYTVKDGSADYIDVDASTGALTIKKVGTATVIVTAAETSTYAQATKEVTVTINKANAVAATVTANTLTYTGSAQALVTVTGEATGGEMQYALGTATEATEQYTTSIPTATNAGTYYVWYKAIGDASHNDTNPVCVIVTIEPGSAPEPAPAPAPEPEPEPAPAPAPATPEEKVADFITRCYQLLLGRQPDATGLKGWTDSLLNRTTSAAMMVRNFIGSPEYQNKNYSSAATVELLYRLLLERYADTQGKAGWAGMLDEGYDVAYVINGLVGSNEFIPKCAKYHITNDLIPIGSAATELAAPASNVDFAAVMDFVTRCYNQLLGRQPDPTGLAGWTDVLANQQYTAANVVVGFVYSQEWMGKHYSSEESVRRLYRAMLNRDVDSSGLTQWASLLKNGYPIEYVINGISTSAEFRQICANMGIRAGSISLPDVIVPAAPQYNEEKVRAFVTRLYSSLLGRSADESGLNGYTTLIMSGAKTPEQVIRDILSSTEFQGRNLGDEDYIRALYGAYLNRGADETGLAGCLSQMSEGVSREKIADSLSYSSEFRAIVNDMKN